MEGLAPGHTHLRGRGDTDVLCAGAPSWWGDHCPVCLLQLRPAMLGPHRPVKQSTPAEPPLCGFPKPEVVARVPRIGPRSPLFSSIIIRCWLLWKGPSCHSLITMAGATDNGIEGSRGRWESGKRGVGLQGLFLQDNPFYLRRSSEMLATSLSLPVSPIPTLWEISKKLEHTQQF